VNHYGQAVGCELRTPQGFEIVGIGHSIGHASLDANDDVAVARDRAACEIDIGAGQVVQLAASGNARTRDVDEAAADLRCAARDGGDFIHVVCAARAGIDPTGHAVLQAHRRPVLAAAGVGVDVDQARRDDLAARIDGVGGACGDVRRYGGNLAGT